MRDASFPTNDAAVEPIALKSQRDGSVGIEGLVVECEGGSAWCHVPGTEPILVCGEGAVPVAPAPSRIRELGCWSTSPR